jgi:Flp pilus assembly protein TadG
MRLESMNPLSRFRRASGGNVAMMFAFTAPFLMVGITVAINFTNASTARTKLNEAADAAALAALTPAMMGKDAATAQAAAIAMFNARAAAVTSLDGAPVATITVTPPTGTSVTRTVTVAYTANVNTILGGYFGNDVAISGTSTSKAQIPPNINFYLLLDNSPSMSLPATTDGIATMQSITSKQDSNQGCAFACHQASGNNGDTAGNLCITNTNPPQYSSPTVNNNTYCASKDAQGNSLRQLDNFAMARRNNITLRLDELTSGVTQLLSTANGYQNSGVYSTPPAYQFAAYSLDSSWQIGLTNLMSLTSSYQSSWTSASSNFGVMEMYANNAVCSTSACTASGGVGDVETNYDNALNGINTILPTPGNGTNASGDKPQEILFFVTDGVEDEATTSCSQPLIGGGRCQAPINPALCTTIKNRGIKIAVLYTQYLAVPTNSWYNNTVAPFQSQIATNLQACASPSMFMQAAVGDNLGTALSNLFNVAVQQASITK